MGALSYEVLYVRFNFSTLSLSYSVMSILGVPIESGIIIMFNPASIHLDCLAPYKNLALNRLMDFDYSIKRSGSLRMELLKSLIPVVDV